MPEKSSFEKLLTKSVYEILDGDTSYGKYESRDNRIVKIGLPYLSGPVLCDISTKFGLPITYSRTGTNLSRWIYVENLLKHCIKNGTCSRLLEFLFSFSQFQKYFTGLSRDEKDSVYQDSVRKAIEGINGQLVFSDSALVFKDKAFQIVPTDRQMLSNADSLAAILDVHEMDPFSSLTEYKQCERIGRGGFGEVYRYHNHNLDMDFAVKIYSPWFVSDEEREEGEKRFFREAKILFSLCHNNIVRIFDAGRIDGNPFIRMEYLQGKSLEEFRSDNGNFEPKSAVGASIQILKGLECAHRAGIIHRDLKPSNVMVITNGKRYICKIIDFGISAFMETEGYTKLTRTGEQIAGGQFIDPNMQSNPMLRDVRSDVYSVGAILYYLLCGRAPIGSDIRDYLHQSNPRVIVPLENVIMKSLSSDIDSRYRSCADFRIALENINV